MDQPFEPDRDLDLIARYAGEPEADARVAFEALVPRIRRFLCRILPKMLTRLEDQEDVTSTVLQRLWKHRRRFRVRSVEAWWVFVATIARRCVYSQNKREVPSDETDEIAGEDLVQVEESVQHRFARHRLYEGADELWLGVDPAASRRDRDRQLLAAQLFFLHNLPWERAARLIGGHPPPQEEFDRWLSSESVLLRLAFSHLYVSNDNLTAILLSVKDGPSTLDHLSKRAREEVGEPPSPWTWSEVRIVLWRYRNGLIREKILQMAPLTKTEEVENVVQCCGKMLPFVDRAKHLNRRLGRRVAFRPLLSPGLWKRLVFQYYAADDLPHRQILERTQEAAALAGYRLTPGMLNVWLGNRRILTELADYLRGRENGA